MASNPPPSFIPPPPTSGSGKLIVAAVLALGAVAGVVVWKLREAPPAPVALTVDAAAPVAPVTATGRNLEDDIPLPPPVEDAGTDAASKAAVPSSVAKIDPCDPGRKCTGASTPALEQMLQFRAKQAHRCYDSALAQDPTLKGKITLSVRVGMNGQTCSANVVSNELGSSQVASCVASTFRGTNFPAPAGGCAEVQIPINFMPRQ